MENSSLRLDQFYEHYSNKKDNLYKYPFQKYDLRFWYLHPYHFTDEVEEGLAQVDFDHSFWTTCAPIIKHLTVHHCDSFGTFTIFSEEFLKALPNLTFLKVLGGTLTPQALEKVNHRFQHKNDYFEHPKLKSVHLELMLPEPQLKELWSVFQKSLPNLENIKIRRLCGGKMPDEFKISDFTTKVIGHRGQLKTLDLVE